MERITTNGALAAVLSPDADGWRVLVSGREDQSATTLEEALALIPSEATLEMAVPCSAALVELHKLPATDRAEISDMLQLQLEKALIAPVENISSGFEIVDQQENESRVFSVAVPHQALDQLCAPLQAKNRLPERITLQALRIPALCDPAIIALAVWPEGDQLTVALIEHGKLSWLQQVGEVTAESLLAELPAILLAAELDGAKTSYSVIYVAPQCEQLAASITEQFGNVVQLLPRDVATNHGIVDLLPEHWRYQANRKERNARLKSRLYFALAIYLIIFLSSFVYIAWLQREVRRAQNRLQEMRPRYEGIAQKEERWKSLIASINPQFYTAEIIHQLTKHCNPALVQFVAFTSDPKEWTLNAEAKNTDESYSFVQELKKDPELEVFQLTTSNTQELKDGRVTFNVKGRLPE